MRKRSAIMICATAAYTIPSPGNAFFLAPPATSIAPSRSGLSPYRSFATSSKPRFHDRSPLSQRVAQGNVLVSSRRSRPRSHNTITSMAFGGGGGGRGSKGPFGLDPGTLATIGFVLLVVFAPGIIFGAFNTLFLVVTVGPLLFSLGINLYNKVNVVDSPCPVCGVQLQGLKNQENQCPSCGAMLMAQNGKFEALGSGYVRDETGVQQEFTRVGDSGVIDVDAIDVED